MDLLIAIELRLQRTPDGHAWTDSVLSYASLEVYRESFDAVRVLARARDVAAPTPGAHRVTGPHISLVAMPEYRGIGGWLRRLVPLCQQARRAGAGDTALLVYMPGLVGSIALLSCTSARRRGFGVNLVGDIFAVLRGADSGRLTRAMGIAARFWIRHACRHASVISYRADILRDEYPPATDAFVTKYSDVDLEAGFLDLAERQSGVREGWRLVTVGSLEQRYKGVHTLLEAVGELHRRGVHCTLDVVGDGATRGELEARSRALGLEDVVNFVGHLQGPHEVGPFVAGADAFVLASYTEGLPRALLEAMALGLPCVATRVGAIPELLPQTDLVPINDPAALADALAALHANPALARAKGRRNRAFAKAFVGPNRARRQEFVSELARRARQLLLGAS